MQVTIHLIHLVEPDTHLTDWNGIDPPNRFLKTGVDQFILLLIGFCFVGDLGGLGLSLVAAHLGSHYRRQNKAN